MLGYTFASLSESIQTVKALQRVRASWCESCVIPVSHPPNFKQEKFSFYSFFKLYYYSFTLIMLLTEHQVLNTTAGSKLASEAVLLNNTKRVGYSHVYI